MTETATDIGADVGPVARSSRVRPWIALAAAAVVFAGGVLGVLPFILALPVIGVVLAFGSPPDHLADGRPIARRPRNAILGAVLIADLTTINGPHMVKTLHTYPLHFRGVSLTRDGVETRPTTADPRRGDFVRPIH